MSRSLFPDPHHRDRRQHQRARRLLAGYGNFPDAAKLAAPAAETLVSDMASIRAFVAGCASSYPSHRAALAALAD